MGKNKWGEITKTELQNQLDNNTGKGITEVSEEPEDEVYIATFLEPKRYYEVDKDGNVIYLGEESELLGKATIKANPPSNTTPKLTQTVELTVTTPLSIEDEKISLVYAWSTSETEEPAETKYTKAILTGTKRNRKATVSSNDTVAGNYYLWTKVIVNENEIDNTFGPYAIKDHTTLVACGGETQSTSGFLGSAGKIKDTNFMRSKIKSITIATSLGTHTTNDANCWDVSQSQDGKYLAWYEEDNGEYNVTIAGEGGVVANSNSSFLFSYIGYDISSVNIFNGLENLDTGLVTTMQLMFYNCINLQSIDLSSFNTANVTNMASMFYECSNLTNLNLSNFDTTNVTTMYEMFRKCKNLIKIDVSNFNTENVTTMSSMFDSCNSLRTLDISNFNTTNVTIMRWMFRACSSLINLNISNFNTINVTNMIGMFEGDIGLTELDISNFNTTNVTTMENMFLNCFKLTNLDLSSFNTKKVTSMSNMFKICSTLKELRINEFDMTNVTEFTSIFYGIPTTVKITTNQTTANWIVTNFSQFTIDKNFEIVS